MVAQLFDQPSDERLANLLTDWQLVHVLMLVAGSWAHGLMGWTCSNDCPCLSLLVPALQCCAGGQAWRHSDGRQVVRNPCFLDRCF